EKLRSTAMVWPGKWYHVIFSVDSGRARFFINGQSDAEPVACDFKPDEKLILRGDPTGQSLIDEIAIYTHPLSADRALAHFKAAIDSLPPRPITTAGHRG